MMPETLGKLLKKNKKDRCCFAQKQQIFLLVRLCSVAFCVCVCVLGAITTNWHTHLLHTAEASNCANSQKKNCWNIQFTIKANKKNKEKKIITTRSNDKQLRSKTKKNQTNQQTSN